MERIGGIYRKLYINETLDLSHTNLHVQIHDSITYRASFFRFSAFIPKKVEN